MKEGIHPKYHDIEARCACGATWKTRSTKPELHLEICNNCHPFFTGRQKLIDTEGRVERFTKRFGAQTSETAQGRLRRPPRTRRRQEAAAAPSKPPRRCRTRRTGPPKLQTAIEQVAVVFFWRSFARAARADAAWRPLARARLVRPRPAAAASAPSRPRSPARDVRDGWRAPRRRTAAAARAACCGDRTRPASVPATAASTRRRRHSADRDAGAGPAGRSLPRDVDDAPRSRPPRVRSASDRAIDAPARS